MRSLFVVIIYILSNFINMDTIVWCVGGWGLSEKVYESGRREFLCVCVLKMVMCGGVGGVYV